MSGVLEELRKLSTIAQDAVLVARLKAERDTAISENQDLRVKVASLEGQVQGYRDALASASKYSNQQILSEPKCSLCGKPLNEHIQCTHMFYTGGVASSDSNSGSDR